MQGSLLTDLHTSFLRKVTPSQTEPNTPHDLKSCGFRLPFPAASLTLGRPSLAASPRLGRLPCGLAKARPTYLAASPRLGRPTLRPRQGSADLPCGQDVLHTAWPTEIHCGGRITRHRRLLSKLLSPVARDAGTRPSTDAGRARTRWPKPHGSPTRGTLLFPNDGKAARGGVCSDAMAEAPRHGIRFAGPYLENRAFGRVFVLPRAVAPSRREPCGARAAATAPAGAVAATALRRIPPRGRAIPRQPAPASKIPIFDPANLIPCLGSSFWPSRPSTHHLGQLSFPVIWEESPVSGSHGAFFGHRVRARPASVLLSALSQHPVPRGFYLHL